MKKIIALVLVVILTTLSLSSCARLFSGFFYDHHSDKNGYFPDGYTGGYGIEAGSKAELYWVETYEEAVSAIEKMKSHGSTFLPSAIFSYEGELFDTKYCFVINGWESDKITYGEDPFDRKCADVEIRSVAFLSEVTIEELVYGIIYCYPAYELYIESYDYLEKIRDLDLSTLSTEWENGYIKDAHICYVSDNDARLFRISRVGGISGDKLSDECINSIVSSIVFFE